MAMDPASGTTSTAYPLIGQVVGGRYHIVALIGEGGMGVVYKAEQRLGSTVRKVAVKTLHAELSRDPSITARFHREVGTVAQLEHPNTVRVYDFGSTDDGTLYIAMEFLDGKALNRVIEMDGALDPKRVGHIVRQIAGSLDEAHRQGIVHRDLKPENVLLIERAGEKDVVKLVDFGIAARTESAEREKEQKLTQQGMVLGTPPYMSPEQFTGKALDARSDVYSLGVMVYEMLTGQLPFQADTAWQWATHHMTSPPRSFDETPGGGRIPEALRRTVLKALSKEPADRQSSAGQFYTEFVASAGNTTSVAPKAAVAAMGKTEAMPQAPPFAMAPTEGMAVPPGISLGASPAAPAIASPPVALPPAPAREQPAGNKGLIYGLSGVGAVLLIAMGVVALSSNGGGGEPAAPIVPTPTTTSTPSAESPAETPPALEPEPSPAEEPDDPQPTTSPEPSRPKPAGSTKPASSKPTPAQPTPKPTAPAQQTTPPAATPTPTPPAQQSTPAQQPTPAPPPAAPQPAPPQPAPSTPAGDPCVACVQQASRDILAASQAYAQCKDSAMQKKCTGRAVPTAVRAAENAANNQKCPEAKAIIQAALLMGVPAGRLAKAQTICK
jgi:eukaryotic-like serine/threonine-protein kinase